MEQLEKQEAERLLAVQHMLQAGDMKAFRSEFLENHTYDQAQLYLALTAEERMQVYNYLSAEEVADMFEIIEEDVENVAQYLLEMNKQYAADMLANMFADNAVAVLKQVTVEQAQSYLRRMPREAAQDIQELFQYEDETAGALMTTEYAAVAANQTVRSAMMSLKALAPDAETIYYVYVVDRYNRLVGILSLRDLIVSDDDAMVYDVMTDRLVSVQTDATPETVAQIIRDYDFLAVPVVSSDQELLGIITVDDVIDVIDEAAASDYSGLAGVDVAETSDNPLQAARKRLPWLMALIGLGMITAGLIGRYEKMIEQASVLSVFVTLITGTAGNAGTQSLAVAVRKLAGADTQAINFGKLVLSELITGLVTGSLAGLLTFVVVGLLNQNFVLGFVIGLAMLCAITVANLAGSLIPIGMEKVGVDPAVASGPFISTLSDLTSVLIYFSIAGYFIQYFLNH